MFVFCLLHCNSLFRFQVELDLMNESLVSDDLHIILHEYRAMSTVVHKVQRVFCMIRIFKRTSNGSYM